MMIDAHAHLIKYITGTVGIGELTAIGNGRAQRLDGTISQFIPPQYGDTGFAPETLLGLMDEAGIDKAALIQGYYYGVCNQYIREAVQNYPDKFVGMGSFDPYIVEREKVLALLVEDFGFRILKFELSEGAGLCGFHPDFRIDGDVMQAIYRQAERWRLAIVFDIGMRDTLSFQVEGMIRVANAYKGVDFVLCHLLAPTGTEEWDIWSAQMDKLAQCKNLYFDISAMPWNIREAYPYPTCSQYVAKARDIAGAQRLIWGSDAPMLLTISTYREQYDYLERSGKFSPGELELMLGGNAQRLYWR